MDRFSDWDSRGFQSVYWGLATAEMSSLEFSEHDMLSPHLKRIGSWIQFEKIDGDGPDEGWLKYYGQGKRLAKRTAANDIAIMQSNFGIVPNEARPGS